jgi:chemotaxis protein methyltransferase CheR
MMAPDYEYLRKFLRQRSGLVLAADKEYLAESRLLPVARKAGLANVSELVQRLWSANAESLAAQVVEAMTTNETFFFRDKIPFGQFRDAMVPRLLATRTGRRRLRIWCAAASSGQEPYSLAMAQGDGGAPRWLAHRDRCDRHLERSAGEGPLRDLQPFRSAARAADCPAA